MVFITPMAHKDSKGTSLSLQASGAARYTWTVANAYIQCIQHNRHMGEPQIAPVDGNSFWTYVVAKQSLGSS